MGDIPGCAYIFVGILRLSTRSKRATRPLPNEKFVTTFGAPSQLAPSYFCKQTSFASSAHKRHSCRFTLLQISFPAVAARPAVKKTIGLLGGNFEIDKSPPLSRHDRLLALAAHDFCSELHSSPPILTKRAAFFPLGFSLKYLCCWALKSLGQTAGPKTSATPRHNGIAAPCRNQLL